MQIMNEITTKHLNAANDKRILNGRRVHHAMPTIFEGENLHFIQRKWDDF